MLTRLAIVDLTNNDILLPVSFLEDFRKNNSQKVAMVYSNQSKTIHFFSLRNGTDWILKIQIEFFPPIRSSNVTKLLEILKERFDRIVFSTGICNYEDDCLWEGYATNHLLPDLEVVKQELSEVPELKKIELNIQEA
ncbi:hypothetical protein [Candidatus Borrarchaeum sp.]|uniref:hypothetical protein n=1 Tax=Candidatus Borrarchaeum sp. TaxID=2846742 RepID=UPI00257F3894|nr:hypothetical protein [Candidatus Borrarchaeum sp.]